MTAETLKRNIEMKSEYINLRKLFQKRFKPGIFEYTFTDYYVSIVSKEKGTGFALTSEFYSVINKARKINFISNGITEQGQLTMEIHFEL